MKSEKTTASSVLIVLLIYVFMAGNTSGELALCIGANWHIAIEPLTHEHYYNRPHIEQNKSSSPGHEYYGHPDSPHCKPCIDIPIFVGPTDNRLVLQQVRPNMDNLISLLDPAVISDHQFIISATPCRYSSTTDQNRFLCSIILLV
jgi:hypothetical protein